MTAVRNIHLALSVTAISNGSLDRTFHMKINYKNIRMGYVWNVGTMRNYDVTPDKFNVVKFGTSVISSSRKTDNSNHKKKHNHNCKQQANSYFGGIRS
jgi:hypothetical protein